MKIEQLKSKRDSEILRVYREYDEKLADAARDHASEIFKEMFNQRVKYLSKHLAVKVLDSEANLIKVYPSDGYRKIIVNDEIVGGISIKTYDFYIKLRLGFELANATLYSRNYDPFANGDYKLKSEMIEFTKLDQLILSINDLFKSVGV